MTAAAIIAKYFKRLGIMCSLFLFQNFMGIQALNYCSVPLFKSLGVKGTNASLFSSGLFGVCKFICTFIYIFLIVDCFGRRIAFLVYSSFCSVFFWYFGAYLKVVDPTKPGVDPGPGGKAAIAMVDHSCGQLKITSKTLEFSFRASTLLYHGCQFLS